jgi:hypothetical protein
MHRPGHWLSRWLSLGATAGPLLFVLCWVVLGSTRPGYSSVSQPISTLAVGPQGGSMRVAFLLNGLLIAVGVIAASRTFHAQLGRGAYWTCLVLLLISPLGVLWDGVFTMDHLGLHNIGVQAAVGSVILTLPLSGLILRRSPHWRRFGTLLLLVAPLTVALLIGFMTSVPLAQMATGGGHYGLWQRAVTIEVQAWYAVLGSLAFRR